MIVLCFSETVFRNVYEKIHIFIFLHCFMLHILSEIAVYGVFYVCWIIEFFVVTLKMVLVISQSWIPLTKIWLLVSCLQHWDISASSVPVFSRALLLPYASALFSVDLLCCFFYYYYYYSKSELDHFCWQQKSNCVLYHTIVQNWAKIKAGCHLVIIAVTVKQVKKALGWPRQVHAKSDYLWELFCEHNKNNVAS